MAKAATNAIRTTVVANSRAVNPEFFPIILITPRITENKTRASSISLIIKYGKSDVVRTPVGIADCLLKAGINRNLAEFFSYLGQSEAGAR